MKHFLAAILVITGWTAGYSQSFELVDKQDSYQGGVGQVVTIPLNIRNTSDKVQFYIFRKIQDDLSKDQKAYFCWEKNCLEPETDEFSKRLEPGETLQNLSFTIETGLSSGQHFIKFEIFPRGLQGLGIEHTVSITIDDRAVKARVFTSKEMTIHDVYPNPVTDQAYIEYNITSDGVKAKVVIHNILGKQISEYELPASENRIKIQADELPAGIYFYTLYLNSQGVLTRKLMVRK